MKNGRFWVVGLLALGVAAGSFTVWQWSRPENAVRWTFTQFHTTLLRRNAEPAKRLKTLRQIAAERVILDGLPMEREDFLSAYVVPSTPTELQAVPCPVAPGHWNVLMAARAWCFAPEGGGWKLHRIGGAPCDEK